ncbi:MAG TPA: hypothetical protein DCE52_14625 [Rhodobacteraceae bacterium]|nr:hypothetical protein [Alphaproteobacteria bacterium]HAB39204.1 hypothetical protein [Paracoccaceae bacterium]
MAQRKSSETNTQTDQTPSKKGVTEKKKPKAVKRPFNAKTIIPDDKNLLEKSKLVSPANEALLPNKKIEHFDEAKPSLKHKHRTGLFLPLFFGGIVAAILGFIGARAEILDPILPTALQTKAPLVTPDYDDSIIVSRLAAVTDRLTSLEASVADLPKIKTAIQSGSNIDVSIIKDEIEALKSQITQIASSPTVKTEAPTEATNAALSELRDNISKQQDEINRLLADQRNIVQDSKTKAEKTLARTAMNAIQSAIDAGEPFSDQLNQLKKTKLVEVPKTLTAFANQGVSTLAMLQSTISDAARNGLAVARNATQDNGLKGFFERQLAVRSITSREGTDPDAILSRVEAAVQSGNIEAALKEIKTLPLPAQNAMNTWAVKAQARYEVVAAANALAGKLSAF